MKAEIICVGDKLLSGELVNVNAAFISSALSESGIKCCGQAVVGASKDSIKQELSRALSISDVVILYNLLDSFETDSVKEAICKTFDIELVQNDNNDLEKYNTVVFGNESQNGYAVAIEKGVKTVILLSFASTEVKDVFSSQILPYLKEKDMTVSVSACLNTFGISEGAILEAIKHISSRKNTLISFTQNDNTVDINVTVYDKTSSLAKQLCDSTIAEITSVLGDSVYGNGSNDLAGVVVGLLRKKGFKISTAESCTSGMLSALITSVPHSSEIFEMGISAYSDRIKREALSIPADIINENGAISWQTAMYLAKNVRLLSDSDIGVGITGNAGPTGDEGKPVGLVYIAVADKNGYFVKQLNLSPLYSRQKIRSYSAHVALDMIRLYAESAPSYLSQFVPYGDTPVFTEQKQQNDSFAHFNTFVQVDDEEEEEDNTIYSNRADAPSETESIPPVLEYESFENIIVDEDGNEVTDLNSFAPSAEQDNKKENVFLTFINKFLPKKTNDVKDFITKIIFIVSLAAFAVSAIALGSHFISDKRQQSIIEQARSVYEEIVLTEADAPKLFDVLAEENPDIKAWITMENTAVDHPIYQTEDNDYYLDHNMYRNKSRYGALFFDYRNKLGGSDQSQNLTIYGHNMNNGSMFGTLKKYKSLAFYGENPTFKITTEDGFDDYVIFAVMIMNATAKDDNGYLYNFTKSSFDGELDFNSWIDEALERSLFISNVSIDANDQILTLVTCDDEKLSFENSRLVIMAKKLDDGEINHLSFGARLNPNPRYPQAWYDAKDLDGYKQSPSTDDDFVNTNSNYVSSDNSFTSNSTLSDLSSQLNSSTSDNSNTSVPTPNTSTPSTQTPSTSTPSTSKPTTPTPSTSTPSTSTPSTSTPSTSTPVTSAPVESTPSTPDTPSDNTTTSEGSSTDDTTTSTPDNSDQEETPTESNIEGEA